MDSGHKRNPRTALRMAVAMVLATWSPSSASTGPEKPVFYDEVAPVNDQCEGDDIQILSVDAGSAAFAFAVLVTPKPPPLRITPLAAPAPTLGGPWRCFVLHGNGKIALTSRLGTRLRLESRGVLRRSCSNTKDAGASNAVECTLLVEPYPF